MLKAENLSSGYGKKQVLYDVSLQVNKGEVVLLTGGNGSGKSTLLKCIYNLLPCWTGEIFFEGKKINGLKPSDLIKRGIVYIPQKDFCFENLTVDENLRISGNTISESILKQRIQKVYELTGLSKFEKRKPHALSGGEKKLLAFGMGLVHQPSLILFDEPFAGVDSNTSNQILTIFNQNIIREDVLIIIVEHKDIERDLFTQKIKMELGKIKNIQL
ncbi:MAG: ATP-binding cassette domain-containing protein [Bacteroidales bacterium]|nr:ATP-binding cassette domain-containing protein [Bacteroidales bacterium]